MADDDDRIAALERHAHVTTEALQYLVDYVRALVVTNAALVTQLGDKIDRDVIRSGALVALGDGPEHARSVALVNSLTMEPAEVAIAVQVDLPPRLH